jgi:hypothetical protein
MTLKPFPVSALVIGLTVSIWCILISNAECDDPTQDRPRPIRSDAQGMTLPPLAEAPNYTLTIKNKTDKPIQFAVRILSGGKWTTSNWYRLDPRSEGEIPSVQSTIVYAYAETLAPSQDRVRWKGTDKEYTIGNDKMTLYPFRAYKAPAGADSFEITFE